MGLEASAGRPVFDVDDGSEDETAACCTSRPSDQQDPSSEPPTADIAKDEGLGENRVQGIMGRLYTECVLRLHHDSTTQCGSLTRGKITQ